MQDNKIIQRRLVLEDRLSILNRLSYFFYEGDTNKKKQYSRLLSITKRKLRSINNLKIFKNARQ